MTYGSSFMSGLSRGFGTSRRIVRPRISFGGYTTVDKRVAVSVENLDKEWLSILEEADYSHLPSKLPA